MTSFLTSETSFGTNVDGLFVHRAQEIDTTFVDFLRDLKATSTSHREGELMRVASVPAVIVEKWLDEGFDVFRESPRAIVARLKSESLDHFVTTAKSV